MIKYSMKFDFKKFLSVLCIFSILVFLPSISSAEEEIVLRVKGEDVVLNDVEKIVPREGAGTYYTKTVQKTWTEWSRYKRVSDNIVVKNGETGSITATDDVTFGAEISGDVWGLDIAVNASVSSSVGYTIETSTPGTYYLGYRVLYNYERGLRHRHSGWSGLILETNNYTAGIPSYGEYVLIRVR